LRLGSDKQEKPGKGRVVSEAYPESEFNLNPSSEDVKGITVEDLMTPLQDTAGFGTVRKRMEQLQKRSAPVEAPLPKIIQDRVNRKAAYEKTSDEITQWQPLVKTNREARTLDLNQRLILKKKYKLYFVKAI
jgi:U3 small nucleolar RNA-associated protein 14